jgi:hypothetical protein
MADNMDWYRFYQRLFLNRRSSDNANNGRSNGSILGKTHYEQRGITLECREFRSPAKTFCYVELVVSGLWQGSFLLISFIKIHMVIIWFMKSEGVHFGLVQDKKVSDNDKGENSHGRS